MSEPNSAPTPSIKNIGDLIARCRELQQTIPEDWTLYFRGESYSSWGLRPSIMRSSDLRDREGDMLLDLMSRRPEDFVGMTSALEQLALARHHGLNTRLLDITRNPCVALFWACQHREPTTNSGKDTDSDGRLHIFAVPRSLVKPFNSDSISVIANFAKLRSDYQNLLLGTRRDDSDTGDADAYPDTGDADDAYWEAMHLLYELVRQEKPYFEERIDPRDLFKVFVVEPKQSFERIRAQAGAFLISAFHERFESDEIRQLNPDMPVYLHDTFLVPQGNDNKDEMLSELQLLNFTRETLLPGLDEAASAVIENYSP